MTWHFKAPEQGELLKQRTSLTPSPSTLSGEGRKAGCVGTTSLLLAFSVFLAVPQPLHKVLQWCSFRSQAGSWQGGPPRHFWSPTIDRALSVRSPRLMTEICTLNMCFCVVEPEIPYLLMESLISFFFFFFVFVAIFCGAGQDYIILMWGPLHKRYL